MSVTAVVIAQPILEFVSVEMPELLSRIRGTKTQRSFGTR
jgi:hypothetical protein